jgi:acyl CoA:acetate/3-ketoacid CoA transferase beta subunit
MHPAPCRRRRIDLVVTDLVAIALTEDGLILRERAPGVSVEEIRAATAARLIVPGNLPAMDLGPWRGARNTGLGAHAL